MAEPIQSILHTSDPIPTLASIGWQEQVKLITRMMRELSTLTDPQEVVNTYGTWVQSLQPIDRFISLSRRGLSQPQYRITRPSLWENRGRDVNPWVDELPIYNDGVLGKLIYDGVPTIVEDFDCPPDDPACEHMADHRSLMAIPLYEDGESINMVIMLQKERGQFDPNDLANRTWMSNLFGRSTKNLVLSAELKRAYERADSELKVVADIQRSLLPRELPKVDGLELAAYYQTSAHSGGDYYDFFELDDGRLGILIADVSGHGTPAAVMMAVTHAVAHTREKPPTPPWELMKFINDSLCARYTNNGTFVTAFYGIYDPRDRTIRYCNAGHNPPIVKRSCGDSETIRLDQDGGLPLGILPDETYGDAVATLEAGDVLVLYTDGITEARRAGSGDSAELFDLPRLEAVVRGCAPDAQAIVDRTIKAVDGWTGHAMPHDDRTLVVGRIS